MVLFFDPLALDWSIGLHNALFSFQDFTGAFIIRAATTCLASFNCDDGSFFRGDFPLGRQKSLSFAAAGLEAHFLLGLNHVALLHTTSALKSRLNDLVNVVLDSLAFDWSIGLHNALFSFGDFRDASRARSLRLAFPTNFPSFNLFNGVFGNRKCDDGRKDEELSHG